MVLLALLFLGSGNAPIFSIINSNRSSGLMPDKALFPNSKNAQFDGH